MARLPDYYSVLGLPPTADRAVIHATWKALLRQYHPDVNHGVGVSDRAKAINEAYAVLGKEASRAAYDRSRRPSSPLPPNTYRPRPHARAGRHPTRPRPSARPDRNIPQHRDAYDWLTGLLLLLLTAAPLGMILVLYNEETRSGNVGRGAAAVQRPLEKPSVYDDTPLPGNVQLKQPLP